jgi:chromosome segregation ATPase
MAALRSLTDDEVADVRAELEATERTRARYAHRLAADDLVVFHARSRMHTLRQQIDACDRHIARFKEILEEAEAA